MGNKVKLYPANISTSFQRCFRLIWRRDVPQGQINVEKTLWTSTLKFTTLKNVESTLSISKLIWTTLDNLEKRVSFSTLGNVETPLGIWQLAENKNQVPIQKQNNIFELQRTCWAQNFLHFILYFERNV